MKQEEVRKGGQRRTASRYTIRDVKRTLKKNAARLLGYKNVLYLGIGEKEKAGVGRKRLAIRVYVSRKGGAAGLIPRRLRGVDVNGRPASFYIPTDVERRPKHIAALSVQGGTQISGVTQGSVALVTSVANQRLILTNAHVAVGVNQHASGQYVTGLSGQVVGRAVRAIPIRTGSINSIDAAALAPAVATTTFSIEGIPVVEYGDLREGMLQPFFFSRQGGQRTQCVRPNWVATPRPVSVDGQSVLFVNFFELRVVGGRIPAAGDSGSAIVSDRGDGLVVHGLLFAGGGRLVGAIGFKRVLAALGSDAANAA